MFHCLNIYHFKIHDLTPWFVDIILTMVICFCKSNLVQYLLQTNIKKRTENIQWQIQKLHRYFSPGNPNRENQHILY